MKVRKKENSKNKIQKQLFFRQHETKDIIKVRKKATKTDARG